MGVYSLNIENFTHYSGRHVQRLVGQNNGGGNHSRKSMERRETTQNEINIINRDYGKRVAIAHSVDLTVRASMASGSMKI
jgi:hypothetical protein